MSWLSICLSVSRATPTTIRRPIPEKAMLLTPVRFWMIWGKAATKPRKRAPPEGEPGDDVLQELHVGSPGRMPGMKPPYSRKDSAMRLGSNCTAV